MMSSDDFFKDPEKQAESAVDQNIKQHISPESRPAEPQKAEVPKEKKPPFWRRLKKPELPKRLVKQPQKIGGAAPSKGSKLKSFIVECKRVLRVTRKPDKQEFATIVKVSALGMAVIGVVGFLISLLKELFL